MQKNITKKGKGTKRVNTSKTLIKFCDYKTGIVPWTQRRVDNDDQLTFYALVVWLKYKKLPDEIKLEWMPTRRNEYGELELTGEIKEFKTERSLQQILNMLSRAQEAWKTIKQLAKEYGA